MEGWILWQNRFASFAIKSSQGRLFFFEQLKSLANLMKNM